MTEAEVRRRLRKRIGKEKQYVVAAEMGVRDSVLSETLHGKRKPGRKILDWLGLRPVRRRAAFTMKREPKVLASRKASLQNGRRMKESNLRRQRPL